MPTRQFDHSRSLAAVALMFAVVAGLPACGGGGNDAPPPVAGPTPPPPPPPPAPTGTLGGVARDAASGLGIANVSVSAGGVTTQTDANGAYTLTGVPAADRSVVRFEAAGYAPTLKTSVVADTGARGVDALMLAVGVVGTVDPAAGGTVAVPGSSAQVVLPANALVRADGSRASASATVEVTPIRPASSVDLMPGDYTSSDSSGAVGNIESFGALAISVRENGGGALNLAAGTSSTIRIPVSSRSASTPATIPLYSLDETTGRWVQQGTATLVNAAQPYYEGAVGHFSFWNADMPLSTIRYHGCIVDNAGARVARVRVASDGIDYTGASSVESAADGSFSVPMKLGGRATITGVLGTMLTNTVSAGPSSSDITNSNCLVLGSASAAVSIKLTWGSVPSDVDSHLWAPDGSHVWYGDEGSLTAAPFANLDVDDVTSFGPEVVTITRLMVGTYRYALHNFSGTNPPGLSGSPVRVEMNLAGGLRIFTPPAGETTAHEWLTVFEFVVDARCNITVTTVNAWGAGQPPAPAAGTPTFCTP